MRKSFKLLLVRKCLRVPGTSYAVFIGSERDPSFMHESLHIHFKSKEELYHESHDGLITYARKLSHADRKLDAHILNVLQTIADQKIHLEMGYGSLFDFCVKELRFSEGSAGRRVRAVRLTQELPDLTQKVESGELSLSTLSLASSFFYHEQKDANREFTPTEKRELLEQLTNKSQKQAESTLFGLASPENTLLKRRNEQERHFQNYVELRVNLTRAQYEKLQRVKSLRSHHGVNPLMSDLLEQLCDFYIGKKDPAERARRKQEKAIRRTSPRLSGASKISPESKVDPSSKTSTPAPLNQSKPKIKSRSRAIPTVLKEKIWKKYDGKCTYHDPKTGRVCGSRHRVQFEHIHPFSQGGEHSEENLTLLCQAHNLLMAEKKLGSARKCSI